MIWAVSVSIAIRRLLAPDHVVVEGITIPARHLRWGGNNFAADRDFIESGQRECARLVELGLTDQSRVLDIGCGPGRLPIALQQARLPSTYVGIDVHQRSISWCQKHLAHPSFTFERIDVENARYNARGGQPVVLPFEDANFDFVYLYSVFSHMQTGDVTAYLAEIARVLSPSGILFFTAFLEEGVPDEQENPPGYRREWEGALHCVRFDRGFFDRLLGDAGLAVASFAYETETDGQSAVVARHV